MKDYYYILGVNSSATEQQIKSAYRKLSMKLHPDKNAGDKFFEERFKELQEAYEVLSDATKRKKYNVFYFSWKNNKNNFDESKYKEYEETLRREAEKIKQERDNLNREKESFYKQQKNSSEPKKDKPSDNNSYNKNKTSQSKSDSKVKEKTGYSKWIYTIILIIVIFIIFKIVISYDTSKSEKTNSDADTIHDSLKKDSIARTNINESKASLDNGTTTDQNGNIYKTVKIGTQIWMVENLNVDHYRNGDIIPEVKDAKEWINLTTGAWCYYGNNIGTGTNYGKLYNWYAVNDPRGLAPKGWHIPNDKDWMKLINYLGGASIASGKLKDSSTIHWLSVNTGATNESGFTALPGGERSCEYDYGAFDFGGYYGNWWSASDYNVINAWSFYMYNTNTVVGYSAVLKKDGLNVRCLKD